MIDSKIAHFEIMALLGSGGMGEVYQATDTEALRSNCSGGIHTRHTSNNLPCPQSFAHRSMICAACVKKQHLGKTKPVVGFSLRVGYSQFVAPRNPRQLWQRTARTIAQDVFAKHAEIYFL